MAETYETAEYTRMILAVALEFGTEVAWLAGMMVRSGPLAEGRQPY
jgi:hypothetical protein